MGVNFYMGVTLLSHTGRRLTSSRARTFTGRRQITTDTTRWFGLPIHFENMFLSPIKVLFFIAVCSHTLFD